MTRALVFPVIDTAERARPWTLPIAPASTGAAPCGREPGEGAASVGLEQWEEGPWNWFM